MKKKETSTADISSILAEIQTQLASLSDRIGRLEQAAPAASPAAAPVAETAAKKENSAQAAPPPPPPAPEISQEEILAISAALAAYLGVRVRIRQIRLISSPAWAQQGRVSIQASHRLPH
jgi:methylmalonyl-CoA carboxyltransferase large subunit